MPSLHLVPAQSETQHRLSRVFALKMLSHFNISFEWLMPQFDRNWSVKTQLMISFRSNVEKAKETDDWHLLAEYFAAVFDSFAHLNCVFKVSVLFFLMSAEAFTIAILKGNVF